jgi:hypothetical protein
MSQSKEDVTITSGGDDAEAVAQYLRDHPDFFVSHKALLADLELPHSPGKTVSLVERQVNILRERNVDMRRQMTELLDTAQRNDHLFNKTRSLTLALLNANSLTELNEVLATHILANFDADFVACHLPGAPLEYAGPVDHFYFHQDEPSFTQLAQQDAATLTTLRHSELTELFPINAHDETGSAVIIPFAFGDAKAVFAIGSRDPAHFASDMDTLFITYIRDVLSHVTNQILTDQ